VTVPLILVILAFVSPVLALDVCSVALAVALIPLAFVVFVGRPYILALALWKSIFILSLVGFAIWKLFVAHTVLQEVLESSLVVVLFAEDILTYSVKGILLPAASVGLAVGSLPHSLTMLHIVFPLAAVGLAIVPFELPAAVAFVRSEISTIDSFMADLQSELFAVFFEPPFE